MYFLKFLFLANICCLVSSEVFLKNVFISFANNGTHTNFVVKTNLSESLSVHNCWVGVGLGPSTGMSGASVVMCTSSQGSMQVMHYYNNGHRSSLLDTNEPSIGLSESNITLDENYLVCSYTRENSNSNGKYFDLNKSSPYIQVAYGSGI